jgi:hypothetical protein
MAVVLEAGADILIRAGWNNARWLNAKGEPVDLIAELKKADESGLIDRPIWIGRKQGDPLSMRLVAVKKPPQAAQAARRKARQAVSTPRSLRAALRRGRFSRLALFGPASVCLGNFGDVEALVLLLAPSR